MKILKTLCAIALIAMYAFYCNAVPAKRGIMAYTQPDGTVVNVTLHGDEFFHYYQTAEGAPLVTDTDGALYFAALEGSTVKRGGLARNGVAIIEDAARVIEVLRSNALKAPGRRAVAQEGMGRFETTFPNKGKLKALVILVQYSDVKFTTPDPARYFSDMLNKDGFNELGATGSAREYFLASSSGQFDLQSDVYGPVTLPYNQHYYGGNNMMGSDENPEDMVVHAIELLKDEVDFSQYDCDKDGILDNVFVFYAGKGEASGGSGNTVWPHAWELSQAGKSFTVDGVLVDHYACTCELQGGQADGVGTFIHEFSHIMGLPDLYNTASSSANYTPGEWSVMDYGPYNNNSRTPPLYSAYERNAMGWLDVQHVTEACSVSLGNLGDSNRAVMISTSRPKEFFLFENRQQTGWDTYLPGHGMLIWHVDFDQEIWRYNSVNNDQDHQYVDLVEANGAGQSKEGVSWPGIHGKTAFTSKTFPAFLDWNNKDPELPLTDIVEVNGKIYFDVDGGDFELAQPSDVSVSEVTPISLRLNWGAVERAKGYVVSAYKTGNSGKEYVWGYKESKIAAPANSVTIGGLEAETEYTFEISAFTGTRMSQISSTQAKTSVMTFEYCTPEILPAEDVADNAFTACWKAVDGASHYLLTVEGSYEVKPKTETCNFGSLIFRVPGGWDYSLRTSKYTDPNYCGKAVPSAKLDKDGASMTSPVFDHDVLGCSFWTRLSANRPESAVKVEGYIDGSWNLIKTVDNLPTRGTVHQIDGIPEGVRSLRFTYLQSGGASLALDDIEIEIGGVSRSILDVYNDLNVGNTTAYRVENLPADETGFYYRVMAVSEAGQRSLVSAEQYVGRGSSSINSIDTDYAGGRVELFFGNAICHGTPGDKVELYAVDGRLLVSTIIGPEGLTALSLPCQGLFIIRIKGTTFKVLNKI